MGLRDTIRSLFAPVPVEERALWAGEFINFGGNIYPVGLNQTLTGSREEIARDFPSMAAGGPASNGTVWACMQARASLFSEARFMYRQRRSGRPGEMFSAPALDILHRPWPGGTTGDLLARAISDLDLAGNAFFVRRRDRIVRLRPDWVTILHGSPNPEASVWDPDAELMGYAFTPGGIGMSDPILYGAEEVAHFAGVMPDPLAPQRGMSWLSAVVPVIEADTAATQHRIAYLANGSTVNLVITGVPGDTPEKFTKWVAEFGRKHDGPRNAFKTAYFTAGVVATAVGSNMLEGDWAKLKGIGEVAIANAAGVPATVLGLSEGLQGSSLNSGNFASAMRRFADLTMRPLWRNICGSLETIVPVPAGAELWYEDRDIPALKDDVMAAAEVRAKDAQAIRQLVDAGFEPDAVIGSINAGDTKRLLGHHSGLYSVQLQPPLPDQTGPEPIEPEPEPEPTAGGE